MSNKNNAKKIKILNTPDDYDSIIQRVEPMNEYDLFTIQKGSVIFRGDHEQKKTPTGSYPTFFADRTSALIYTRGDPEKLSTYVFKKQPKLFHLSYKNILNLIYDPQLNGDEKAAINQYLQATEDEDGEIIPYIIPIKYLKGEENIKAKLYLNRRILNLVCRLGFNGWIAMPNELIQRNLVGFDEKEKPQYRLNPYNPEIAICKWSEFLDSLDL